MKRFPAVLLALAACGPNLKSAESAAAAFADRYYVEADLAGAEEISADRARERLAKERSLAGAARGQGQSVPPQGAHSRIYYEREAVEVLGDRAVVTFKLRIQPPGDSAAFHKSTMLTLGQKDGLWRVLDIAESVQAQ